MSTPNTSSKLDDIDLIALLAETGLNATQVANAIVKAFNLNTMQSTAAQLDNTVNNAVTKTEVSALNIPTNAQMGILLKLAGLLSTATQLDTAVTDTTNNKNKLSGVDKADLDLIGLMAETGLTAAQVADAIKKSKELSKTSTEINEALTKLDSVTKAQIDAAVLSGGGTSLTTDQTAAIEKIKGLEHSASEIDGIISNFEDYISSIDNIYISTMYYTKSHKIKGSETVVLATKTTSKSITVTTLANISTYDKYGHYSIVIKYTDNTYKSYICDTVDTATGIITLDRELEDKTVYGFSMMFDSENGQHLTAYGYSGFAQFIYDELKNEKKINKYIWKFNPYECVGTGVWGNPDIKNLDGTTFLDVSFYGGANGGGYVANTDNTLNASIGIIEANPDVSTTQRKRYSIKSGTAGQGVSFPVTLGVDGYIEIGLGINYSQSYTLSGVAKYTRGGCTVVLLDNLGVEIFNKTITSGLDKVMIPISNGVPNGTLIFKTATSEPTTISISEILIWEGTIESVSLKNKNIGVLSDSWSQYPLTSTEYAQKPTRPYDGAFAEGYQYLTVKMEEYALTKNELITTKNYGRGGQTSEWGKYWSKNLKNNSLDYAICAFYINDNNSVDEFTTSTVSGYDFSLINPYSSQNSDAGGVFGSTSYDKWILNIQNIKEQINGLGAKAIMLSPSHTASSAQTNSTMNMNGMFLKYLI